MLQAVILAAGEGTRMRPLTIEKPKPLINVSGTPILSHIMGQLPHSVNGIVLVIEYKGGMIRKYYGDEFEGRPIEYVEQRERGTFGALASAEEYLTERFLVLNGDDLVFEADLKNLLRKRTAILAARHREAQNFGVISKTVIGAKLLGIEEQPERPRSNLVNTGAYVLTRGIFEYRQYATRRGDELLLTPAITAYAKDHPMDVVETNWWCPIGTPEAIPVAEQMLLRRERLDLD